MNTNATNRTTPFAGRQANRAITLIEALAVLGVLALLAWMILFPSYTSQGTRRRAQRINCLNNLKQIGIAFRLFAVDHNNRFPQWLSTNDGGTLEFGADIAAHFRVLSNELRYAKLLHCPADSRRHATDFATLTAANISYFLGMEPHEPLPQMILAGDDNLTTNRVPTNSGWLIPRTNVLVGYREDRHISSGNVVMSDGHAEQLGYVRLEEYMKRLPNLTNRFLLP